MTSTNNTVGKEGGEPMGKRNKRVALGETLEPRVGGKKDRKLYPQDRGKKKSGLMFGGLNDADWRR